MSFHHRTPSFFLIVLLLVAATPALADEDLFGSWLVFAGDHAIGDTPWRAVIDLQARYPDLGSGANQLVFRPSVGYQFANGVSAFAGYGRFRTHTANGDTNSEDRYWQQLGWQHGALWGGKLSWRLRVEQRHVSLGSDTALVGRFMAQFVKPIGTGGGRQLIASVEPFVDFRDTDWAVDRGVNQLRGYLGVRQAVNDGSAVEVGYLNQTFLRDNAPDRHNHLLMLIWRQRF